MGICLSACNFKIYNVNGIDAVLDVIRYLSFASGVVVVNVDDICSCGTLLANVIVLVCTISHVVVEVLYFCNIISTSVVEAPTCVSL